MSDDYKDFLTEMMANRRHPPPPPLPLPPPVFVKETKYPAMIKALAALAAVGIIGIYMLRPAPPKSPPSPVTETTCPVKHCILVTSTEWSEKLYVGNGLDWTRQRAPGILELRVDGDNTTIKKWDNSPRGPDYSHRNGQFVQVRLASGSPVVAYFDTPANIEAYAQTRSGSK